MQQLFREQLRQDAANQLRSSEILRKLDKCNFDTLRTRVGLAIDLWLAECSNPDGGFPADIRDALGVEDRLTQKDKDILSLHLMILISRALTRAMSKAGKPH